MWGRPLWELFVLGFIILIWFNNKPRCLIWPCKLYMYILHCLFILHGYIYVYTSLFIYPSWIYMYILHCLFILHGCTCTNVPCLLCYRKVKTLLLIFIFIKLKLYFVSRTFSFVTWFDSIIKSIRLIYTGKKKLLNSELLYYFLF